MNFLQTMREGCLGTLPNQAPQRIQLNFHWKNIHNVSPYYTKVHM